MALFVHLRHGRRKVAVHSNPVHFTAHSDLFLTDNRNIIFSLTCDQAGVAAYASVEVNCHTPLVNLITDEIVLLVLVAFPRRGSLPFVKRNILRCVRVDGTLFTNLGNLFLEGNLVSMVLDVVGRDFPSKRPAIHRVMLLNEGHGIALLNLFDGDGFADEA